MKWLPARVQFDVLQTNQLEASKRRPLTAAEFQAMLNACGEVRGHDPESWRFLLRGLWESGLRLSEAMSLHWTDSRQITPVRTKEGHVLLRIPAAKQKSRREQTVPTIPQLANLLESVPADQRTGWVFNPATVKGVGRVNNLREVGRVISAIGRKAGVLVTEVKPASAHDLRQSFGQRIADAGMPPRDLQAIMRHSTFTTTE